MYISYANLWKLLIDKGITRTELMELSKISSRTLAKLSKNQTVTTETLLSVCEALNCGISDIMEIREGEESLTFYEAFKRNAEIISKDKLCTTYSLSYNGSDYIIKKTNRAASKHTVIHCEGENVIWEQLYPLVGVSPAREKNVIAKKSFAINGAKGVLIINGTPLSIKNLDDNGFQSVKRKAEDGEINVITKAEMKIFKG